ncbi:MAG: phosphonate ABC transporter, permease protein PhnE [Candidatus Carbobacillus sp.]|nr:phosphonate ABC transporter, permease protein PhnE [Candidatus Carbobacillus sp.]
MTTTSLPKAPNVWRRRMRTGVIILVLAVIYGWSFTDLSLNTKGFAQGWLITKNIFKGLFSPEWSYSGEVLMRLFESIEMAWLGTFIAAILAIPFGFWAASHKGHTYSIGPLSGKWVLSAIRTFPEIILAVVFIVAVGPGAFAGILALGVHSIGMLGKLYSEAIENIDPGPIEALEAVGANKLQILWYAILPQVLPEFASFAIYRFEINVRAATVLGIVGAGGIGTPLIFALQGYAWSRVGIIMLGIIVAVMIIDGLSGYIRSRLV